MTNNERKIKAEAVFNYINGNKSINNGAIFGVTFIKRTDGSERTMSCRLSTTVKTGRAGGVLKFDPLSKNLLPVFDMANEGYRFVDAESVVVINHGGESITFD